MITALLVLLGVALWCFVAAARSFWNARLGPDALVPLGLALVTLAFALWIYSARPPGPEPPEPPAIADFGGLRPHLQGDGSTTPAGRGGALCRITSLVSTGGVWGDGTARGCLEGLPPGCTGRTGSQETCAAIVVSDVSGAIDFNNGTLYVSSPYRYFAGATAPSCNEGNGSDGCDKGAGGLTFQRVHLIVDTHDTYWGHLRLRRSPSFASPLLTCLFPVGGYDCGPVHDNVFDHLSIAWSDMADNSASGANNLNAAQPTNSRQIFTDSILAEPLWYQAWGGINAAACGVFSRNLLANASDRNPIFSGGRCAFFSNLLYNTSGAAPGGALLSAQAGDYPMAWIGRIEVVLRDNVYVNGPDTGTPASFLGLYVESPALTYNGGGYVYLSGNSGRGLTGPTPTEQWNATQAVQYGSRPNQATGGAGSNLRISCSSGSGNSCVDVEPPWFADTGFMVTPAADVQSVVLNNAGARPHDRDAADKRIVGDVTDKDGTLYLDWARVEALYGGQPPIVRRTRVCTPPSNPHGAGSRTLADGSTNTRIEDWLEGLQDYDGTPGCGARRLEQLPTKRRPS